MFPFQMMSSADDVSYIVSGGGGSGSNHIGATNPVFGRAGMNLYSVTSSLWMENLSSKNAPGSKP